MPGKKRKGSKRGGPNSHMGALASTNNLRANQGPRSYGYEFKTTKRVRPKKKK